MPDDYNHEANKPNPLTSPPPSRAGRAWLVWLAVLGGILLLMVFRERPGSETLSQHQFEKLVDLGQITHATVLYDPQNPLNEVVGKYYKIQGEGRIEVPFRTRVRMTSNLEETLLSLPQIELNQANTALMSVVWSVLPIVIIAALIWFFFIRQLKQGSKGVPSAAEIHARSAQQQDRFEKLLDKWEQQTKRMDGVLETMERDSRR
jgi:ATP-dependent Zn protease